MEDYRYNLFQSLRTFRNVFKWRQKFYLLQIITCEMYKKSEIKLKTKMANQVRSKSRAGRDIKTDLLSPVTVSIFGGLETRGPPREFREAASDASGSPRRWRPRYWVLRRLASLDRVVSLTSTSSESPSRSCISAASVRSFSSSSSAMPIVS